MIQAKELRIGNFVSENESCSDGFVKTVDGINIAKIGSNSILLSNGDIYESDEIYPIPLTEEWLLRFGFKWQVPRACLNLGKFSIILPYVNPVFPKGRVYFNSWCILEPPPMHVHQIQNLFYALTGQELEIKEQP